MLTHASAAKQSAPAGQDHARETAKPASRRSQVAVRGILGRDSLQRAIKVGRADDAHEREAERVAAQVVEMPAPGPVSETNNAGARNSAAAPRIVALAEEEPLALQRAPAEESLDEERPGEHLIQFALRSAAAAPPDELPLDDPRLRRLFGGGQPLPTALRADMEGRFGEDFGPVRIHTDAQSAELAAELNARAFVVIPLTHVCTPLH